MLCSSVPIARTGSQLYLLSEIECEGKESLKQKNGLIEVFREPEEVFSEKTIASFTGKPITDGHPMDSVNADNHAVYSKGTVMTARRGTGEFSDCILADLLISDSSLIEEIASGKRGISAGYGCRYEIKDRKLCQTDIICNHVAVVREGRAGKRIEIRDESLNFQRKVLLLYGFIIQGFVDLPEGNFHHLNSKLISIGVFRSLNTYTMN